MTPSKEANPGKRATYHHGRLREALIEAADAIIRERRLEGFSLREANAVRCGKAIDIRSRRLSKPASSRRQWRENREHRFDLSPPRRQTAGMLDAELCGD